MTNVVTQWTKSVSYRNIILKIFNLEVHLISLARNANTHFVFNVVHFVGVIMVVLQIMMWVQSHFSLHENAIKLPRVSYDSNTSCSPWVCRHVCHEYIYYGHVMSKVINVFALWLSKWRVQGKIIFLAYITTMGNHSFIFFSSTSVI